MHAFTLTLGELHSLLHPKERHYIVPELGVVVSPYADPEEARKNLALFREDLQAKEDFSPSMLDDMLELVDEAEIVVHCLAIHPQDVYPEIDTTGLPDYIVESGFLETLPKHRTVKTIIGRSKGKHFTIIRDEGVFHFISQEIKTNANIMQIVDLLKFTIGEVEPHKMNAINISHEQTDKLSNVDSITTEHGFEYADMRKLNELLGVPTVQKTVLIIEAKSFKHPTSSPLAITVIDFEGKGRILSRPYESFEGTVWVKFSTYSDKELEKALREMLLVMNVDWYTHQR